MQSYKNTRSNFSLSSCFKHTKWINKINLCQFIQLQEQDYADMIIEITEILNEFETLFKHRQAFVW